MSELTPFEKNILALMKNYNINVTNGWIRQTQKYLRLTYVKNYTILPCKYIVCSHFIHKICKSLILLIFILRRLIIHCLHE